MEQINNKYKYWGFGLKIASDMEFPELLLYDFDIQDVEYITGRVPDSIQGTMISEKNYSYVINERELLFTVNNVARYYATDGRQIIIEPLKPILDIRGVRLYVLATVMAAVLLHRNSLPIHASAIRTGENLVLITGDSRAGKSTALAGLHKKGYTVFSDDVVVLQNEASGVSIAASYPMIKLWNDTLEKMNDAQFEDRSFRIQQNMDKYGFFFHDHFDRNRYPVKKVFVLKIRDIPNLTHRALSGKDAFEALVKQVYRPTLLQSNDLKRLCFLMVSDIVKNGCVMEISRPVECDTHQLVDYVETLL
ncbi:MAG: hypothetical protein PHT07_23010 [Paludibacter sp.]|nr:hypothetical protein [Paludibacter sp.]